MESGMSLGEYALPATAFGPQFLHLAFALVILSLIFVL
jgi:hypothetical protein